ncbi:hypothetical protein VTI28DRAFT_5251 [Corynascus sepedonium]
MKLRSFTDGDAAYEQSQSRPTKRFKFDATSPLCEQCQKLNLDAAFESALQRFQDAREGKLKRPEELVKNTEGNYFYTDAFFVHRFGDRLSRESSCPLCTYFRSMRMRPEFQQQYKLLAFPSSESWMWRPDVLRENPAWKEMNDTVFMAVVPDCETLPLVAHDEKWMVKDIPRTGVIYRLGAHEERGPSVDLLARANELQSEANLKLARDWLAACQKLHSSACGKRGGHEPIERGFRLINCMTDPPKVEPHTWGTKYAALSYVWGMSEADNVDWPRTVMDAVTVTKKMGLQYIWVDRLCINQADDDEKMYLISRMTTVYEEAELTIVAAAGSGAGHGLPGISSTTRTPQPRYTLDSGSTLLSSLRDPRYDILESDYWTRGWTYQEGVLSNRKLVFTQNQIYWECRSMAAQESMAIPLFHQPLTEEEEENDDEEGEAVMANFMITGIFKSDAYSGGFLSNHSGVLIAEDEDDNRLDYGFPRHLEATTRAQLRGLNEHIRAYSKRRLTHDSDALAAFMGITGLYNRSSSKLHLLYGLPIWLGPIAVGTRESFSGAQITFALTVSAWYHRAVGHQRAMFVSEPACRRRTNFPSWSWAGWTGVAVSWRVPPNNEHCALMADLIELTAPPRGTSRLLWAADTFLFSPGQRADAIRLRDYKPPFPAGCLDEVKGSLVGLQDPFVLNHFTRKKTDKQWRWARVMGRVGRDQKLGESPEWDRAWHRIAGRLCCVCLSIGMSEEEWTAKHLTGELVSVLMFACRYPAQENQGHGGARFLTLRRVQGAQEERWERVGTLFLIIPKISLDKCSDNEELLKQIPVREWKGTFVIQ